MALYIDASATGWTKRAKNRKHFEASLAACGYGRTKSMQLVLYRDSPPNGRSMQVVISGDDLRQLADLIQRTLRSDAEIVTSMSPSERLTPVDLVGPLPRSAV